MRTLLFYCLIILNINLFGQEFYFKNIGIAQGLPSSETYHSLQDSKGFIWITTDAGICKYDGKTITTYTTKDGLPENVVFNVYEDVHGRIWFNSMSGYLFYFENNAFHSIAANSELKKIASLGISSFFLGENDTIFLGLIDLYYVKIPPEKNYSKLILHKVNDNNLFFLINKLKDDELLTAYNNSIFSDRNSIKCLIDYSNKGKKVEINFDYNIRKNKSNCSRCRIDKFQNIYIDCANKLVVIPYSGDSIQYYDSPSEILFIYSDKFRDLWIGTKNGGYFYKNSDLRSKPIRFLKELSISDIMIDRENNIWVCSLQKGVFKSVNKDVLEIFSENDNVSNFYKNDENIYVGFGSKKTIRFNKDDSNSLPSNISELLPKNCVLQYLINNGQYSYYGTSEGLYFVKNQKNILIETLQPKKNPNVISKKIIEIGKDSFAITSTLDIYFVNNQKNYKQIRPPFIVKSMIQVRNKTLLIGSRNNEGIYQYKNNEFSPYLKEYPQLKTRINDMVEDFYGNLWIATNEKGLFCYSNNKLYEFNQTKGLNSNKINELDVDKYGNVWLATNVGINKISTYKGLEKAVIYGFNSSHGLPNLEIDHLTVFNGKVWCSTKEHLFYFDSNKMIPNTVPPLIYIKSVLINDSSIRVSIAPVLKYDENNITFEFTGISYKNTDKKEFLYKLNGYETEWKSSTTGQCQYTNLPYGDYIFQVYALNNDKIKSTLPATFNFSILKPFWFSWWFIIIEIILLIIFVYLVIRWRVYKITRREEEKTLINQKLAEFQMTAVRAQMNPHFVFNAISSIQHYILTNDKYNSYEYLAKFSHLIRNVLDNSNKEYIALEKEIITLSLYIELEKIRFKIPFKFSLTIDEELDQSDIYIPTMLIQPYIENAIWHGLMPKKNDCLLELEIKKINSDLRITIKDNGVGRGVASQHKNKEHVSKAMQLMEQRLKALSIKNNASFTAEIIDLQDENDKSSGTKVYLFMPLMFD